MSFYDEVLVKDNRFGSLLDIREISMLEPVTRAAIQCIIDQAKAQGIDLIVTETYRSTQRQLELWTEKKTKLKNVGVHHYGLACDFAKLIGGIASWAGDWGFLGKLAKANGLIWGGDWGNPSIDHTWRDYDHVQRCALLDQSPLFEGTWYPDSSYNPYGGNYADISGHPV